MEAYMWIILASMLAVGVGVGFVVGRSRNDAVNKVVALEKELKTAQEEMAGYRGQVVEHFGKTAELFNQLTNDYRAVHQHLASSSETLCGDQVAKLISTDSNKNVLENEAEVAEKVSDDPVSEVMDDENIEEVISAAETTSVSENEVMAGEEASVESASDAISPSNIEDKANQARIIH